MFSSRKVGIIGGGLVGALCACYLSERKYDVFLYEKREDIRKNVLKRGKSINLALSNRGRNALKKIGLEGEILKNAVPMKGRLLHDVHGNVKFVPYDVIGNQCLYSINRNTLNQILLSAAENKPNVKLHFNHEFVSTDFDSGILRFKNENLIISEQFDLIIGSDGAHSSLRKHLQEKTRFSFAQKYIDHGYIELKIPSEKPIEIGWNFLHIWPRNDFMMIALPNLDNSFTVTLFMPFENFNFLTSSHETLAFFKSTFPDSIPLLGEDQIKEIPKMKPRSLITIKCSSYHFNDKYLLIGDAAHAMVPFYGQGMNSGFEDCLIFDEILDGNYDDFKSGIKEFSLRRVDDGLAICDLALYNYREMRDLVTKDSFLIRKKIDDFLYRFFPNFWIPLYISVTFTNIPYKDCVENKKFQDKVLKSSVFLFSSIFLVISLIFLYL